eukprot:TRINITY_DN345_c0_g1_i3.p1 TRINITY_DN345_c0_g1~~TRINITY_DN345_c0_g1_i3.p1  ORF type:complete len:346 (-),score=71.82 TRINITY_DN345_c0_g1_i3:827-1864(-)
MYDCEVVGFEGPEKRLELDFKRNPDCPAGLKSLSRDQITELLDLARCSIVGSTSNEYFDSYVLSESSLFVYPTKFMIKTCGTTTLLNCIPRLLELATSIGLEIELVMYSRKNFLFPHKQMHPHISWPDEIEYLNKMFNGTAYVLGPYTQDHWYLYLADYSDHTQDASRAETTLEIMMHNLDRNAADQFYRRDGIQDNEKLPGIADLIPGSITDEFNFTPCGYSMNGLFHNALWTIHVTPEPHCSYASFETNLQTSNYNKLISHVCEVFKPGTFTVTLFKENGNYDHNCITDKITHFEIPGYVLTHKTISELDGCCDVLLCNYTAAHLAINRKRNGFKRGGGIELY